METSTFRGPSGSWWYLILRNSELDLRPRDSVAYKGVKVEIKYSALPQKPPFSIRFVYRFLIELGCQLEPFEPHSALAD